MYVEIDGRRVRRMRGSRAFSGAHYARRAGISPTTLRRVERNRGAVTLHTARKIGAALDVHPRAFCRVIPKRPA